LYIFRNNSGLSSLQGNSKCFETVYLFP